MFNPNPRPFYIRKKLRPKIKPHSRNYPDPHAISFQIPTFNILQGQFTPKGFRNVKLISRYMAFEQYETDNENSLGYYFYQQICLKTVFHKIIDPRYVFPRLNTLYKNNFNIEKYPILLVKRFTPYEYPKLKIINGHHRFAYCLYKNIPITHYVSTNNKNLYTPKEFNPPKYLNWYMPFEKWSTKNWEYTEKLSENEKEIILQKGYEIWHKWLKIYEESI